MGICIECRNHGYQYKSYSVYVCKTAYTYLSRYVCMHLSTSNSMDRWKSTGGKSQRRAEKKQEDKVANHCVFTMICGSGGSKSRLPKAAGPEPSGQLQDEKLHDVVAPSQNVQSTPFSDRFRKLTCRKSERRCCAKQIWKSKCTKHTMLGALLEVDMSKKCTPLWRRSAFPSQNVQNTPCLKHFWKLRCRKSARSCGRKLISKSKCGNHTMLGILLEVDMSKKCTPLRCEAHFQVKMYKAHQSRTAFGSWDVEKVHAVVARSSFASQNVQNALCSKHVWKLTCRKSARRCGAKHISKSKCEKHTTFNRATLHNNDNRNHNNNNYYCCYYYYYNYYNYNCNYNKYGTTGTTTPTTTTKKTQLQLQQQQQQQQQLPFQLFCLRWFLHYNYNYNYNYNYITLP